MQALKNLLLFLSQNGKTEFKGFDRDGNHFIYTFLRPDSEVDKGKLKRGIHYFEPIAFFEKNGDLWMEARIISSDDHSCLEEIHDVKTCDLLPGLTEILASDILKGLAK